MRKNRARKAEGGEADKEQWVAVIGTHEQMAGARGALARAASGSVRTDQRRAGLGGSRAMAAGGVDAWRAPTKPSSWKAEHIVLGCVSRTNSNNES